MEDHLDALDGATERRRVEDVGLDEVDLARVVGEVLAPARREIVDDANAIAACDQRAPD